MTGEEYLKDILLEFQGIKLLGDRALAQLPDDDLYRTIDNESNSIAIIVKHLAGNMRSRWTDFLTTDGEKPDRHRDTEFELYDADSSASLRKRWDDGWKIVFDTISSLTGDDLTKPISIRGREAPVYSALHRQLTHYASHVGQIVLLAKHFRGDQWQTLSVPRGKSAEFNKKMFGSTDGGFRGGTPA